MEKTTPKYWYETGDYFAPGALEVDFPCEAEYSQNIHAETYDALIEAAYDHYDHWGPTELDRGEPNVEADNFLGRLWNRGFKVVPR